MIWYRGALPKVPEAIKQLDAELKKGSDRVVALLAGAVVEAYLKHYIERHTFHSPEMWDRLTHPSGPLGSFSVNIDVAYMFGLISEEAHGDLRRIKDIRNLAAHQLDTFSFSLPKIQSKCLALKTLDAHVKTVRSRGAYEFQDIGNGQKFWIGSKNVLSEVKTPKLRFVWCARVFTVALGIGEYRQGERII